MRPGSTARASAELFDRGITHYNARRYSLAVSCFQAARRGGPQDPKATLFLAYAQRNAGRLDAALRTLSGLLRSQPRCAQAFVCQGEIQESRGRLPQAAEAYRRAAAFPPRPAGLLLRLARIYERLRRWAQAETVLRAETRQKGAGPEPFIRLREVLLLQGRFRQAEAALRAAKARSDGLLARDPFTEDEGGGNLTDPGREPRGSEAHARLARIHRQGGRLKDAKDEFMRALRLRPHDPWLHTELGEVRLKLGQPGRALSSYRKAVEFGAGAGACLRLGELLSAAGKRIEARAFYHRVLLAPPSSGSAESRALASLDRMRAALMLGRFQAAFQEAEVVLTCHPSQRMLERAIGGLSAWPCDLKVLPDLVRRLQSWSRRMPRNPWPSFLIADALEKLNRIQEAIATTEPLLRAPRRYGWMRWLRGRLLLNHRCDFRGAEQEFLAALKSAPWMWQAKGHLAEIALCRGDEKEAFRILDGLAASLEGQDKAQAFAWRGELRLWRGEYRQALGDLEEGVRGGAPFAFCWRGATLLRLGKPREALKDLDAALHIDPQDSEARTWRGEAFRLIGEPLRALEDLVRPGGNFWAVVNRALVREGLGDFKGMRSDFEALPPEVIGFFRKSSSLGPFRGYQPQAARDLLRAGLALGRGVRRPDRYLFPVWMRGGEDGAVG